MDSDRSLKDQAITTPIHRTMHIALGLVAGVVLTFSAALPVAAEDEFQVNTYTTSAQISAGVSCDAGGGFVVVWQSREQDGDGYGAFGQRYDGTGMEVGTEFQINTYTTNSQQDPAVSTGSDGDFIVVWESNGQDGDGNGVFGQRYDGTGLEVSTEFQINTYTTNGQQDPDVSTESNGDFVAVWESSAQDGSSFGVFAQRYDSSGMKVGAEFQVNTYTSGRQDDPAVSSDTDGDFVVVWREESGLDGDSNGVFAQRYDSSGMKVGTEFQVNTYTTNDQNQPAVCCDAAGDFVVVWTSYQDGDEYGVFGQRYASNGTAQGSEFQVNSYTTGYQYYASVSCEPDGAFVVAWSGDHDGDGYEVFARRYDSAGNEVGGEFQVNTYTTGSQKVPVVCCDAKGDFVVAWESPDGDRDGIFGRTFLADPLVRAAPTLSTAGLLVAAFLLALLGSIALRNRSRPG